MPTFAYAFVWVDDVLKAVEFYERAFGLQRRFARENGPLGWYAELETGATTLAIADSKEALAILPPGTHRNVASEPPGAFQVSFLSPDVDGTYRLALEAGGIGLMAPTLQPWGQTVARLGRATRRARVDRQPAPAGGLGDLWSSRCTPLSRQRIAGRRTCLEWTGAV